MHGSNTTRNRAFKDLKRSNGTAAGSRSPVLKPPRLEQIPEEKMDLSVVIVSYNTKELLRQCLRSIFYRDQLLVFEVVVVDNASTDGSAEMVDSEFPEVRLLRNPKNVGFSVANNAAVRLCRGRFILLLNPDTIVLPDTLSEMVGFLRQNEEVGIAGCRLVRPNGELDLACRRSFPTPLVSLCRFLKLNVIFPRSRFFGRYNLTYRNSTGTYEVDSIVGAFMMLRREVIDDVGGLDEDYFMYGEDLDWCYRIKKADWKVAYVGVSHVIHYKGASSRQESFRMNYHFHRAMLLFHRKHLSRRYPLLVNVAVYMGVLCRFSLLAGNHYLARMLSIVRAPGLHLRKNGVCDYKTLIRSSITEDPVKS